ncbi:MAG: biopolymer transporter ExbD [Bacteroidetes bacterium]|jgi:biopolymer transport protein ExbD|nr:biopolymer transporter ExbD [Bacteroidota bacterium]MBP7255653.1 biopolymer transporter ExbD [Chitinophagales bacterium]MBK7139190.1 biopolymer transporter ExbD [Bacteroidota bacterium]MBK7504590.1 biopolymer transporter ExbD [Bacteroidota bacterium]MBK7640127.1 biopolymer transporter ExbD [Bacteroidota bacterium]
MGIQKRSKITPDFNMSSMTDLVFLLLIFFMLTSSAVNPNALNLVLPSSDSQVQATETLSLSIDADLNYYLETQKMPFENLQSALAARIQNKENQTVILNAEKSVPIENVVKVMSIASELKIKMILATQSE